MVRGTDYSQFNKSSLCIGEQPLPTAAVPRDVSSNLYASGANQNSGNMMTGRSSTRVAQPPGGASSICIGGFEPSQARCAARSPTAPEYATSGYGSRAQARPDTPPRQQTAPPPRQQGRGGYAEPGFHRGPVEDIRAECGGYGGDHEECGNAGYYSAGMDERAAYNGNTDDIWRGEAPTYEEVGGQPSRTREQQHEPRVAVENDASFSNRRPNTGNAPAKLNQKYDELCAAGSRHKAYPQRGASSFIFG